MYLFTIPSPIRKIINSSISEQRTSIFRFSQIRKADITIPLAFELAATVEKEDIASVMRRNTRDAMKKYHLMERMVRDIQTLFAADDVSCELQNAVYLCDDKQGCVENGRSYSAKE